MKRHFPLLLALLCALLLGAAVLPAQTAQTPHPSQAPPRRAPQQSQTPLAMPVRTNVVVDTNPTLFAVLAAINVAGYDAGLHASHASPLRTEVRDQLLARNLPVFGELRMYYLGHRKPDAGQDLAQYISLALFLDAPPELHFTVERQQLPPDVTAVADFVPLLRRFCTDANIDALYRRYQPVYDHAIDQYSAAVRQVMNSVDFYFRLPQAYLGRQLFVYPEILASPVQTHARNYLENYFIVVNLDVPTQIEDIRHTYLHYVLDPLVSKYPGAVLRTEPLQAIAAQAPALDAQFKRDPYLFYTECLVHAVEARLTHSVVLGERRVADDTADGLVLTNFFYRQLAAYEKDVISFSEFYPDAVYSLDVRHETDQLKGVRFAAAPARPQSVQPVKMVSLLDAGEARLQARDIEGARSLAQTALAAPAGDHAAAHYLLAVIAARQGQPALAKDYFQRSLSEAALTQAHVRTWSNIYLARIFDLEQNRDQAVSHYRAALATADTPAARAIAEKGLQQAFVAKVHN